MDNEFFVLKLEKRKDAHGAFVRNTKRKIQGINTFKKSSKIEEIKLSLPKSIDNNDDNFDIRSKHGTVAHEYAHYVEDLNKRRLKNDVIPFTSAEYLYTTLDGKSDQGILQKVFNQYGDPEENRREGLLGYSTEELFYPGAIAASKKSSNPVLYGSDRVKEADDILHFTMGYWVQQAIVANEE